MIELPQAEVLRKDLEKDVVGKRVKEVTVKAAGLVPRHRTRPGFVDALVGRKIESVTRRGVHLVFGLDDDHSLVATLAGGSSLTRETASTRPGPAAQLVATFTTGGALHYNDEEGRGEFAVLATAELDEIPELGKLGVEPHRRDLHLALLRSGAGAPRGAAEDPAHGPDVRPGAR